MRFWIDHRLEEDTFAESLRGFVRNTPWWGISAVAHLLVLLILWQIPVGVAAASEGPRIEAVIREPVRELDTPKDQDPVKPDIPVAVTEPVDVPDVPTQSDTDEPFNKPEGRNGERSGPTENFLSMTPIGVGSGGISGRGPGGRGPSRGTNRGPREIRYPVMAGLRWLADHQDLLGDGRWDCDNYMKHDPADDRCDGPGHPLYDVGVSGLALLAFLGAGYTDRGTSTDPFVRNVRKGLRFLISVQDEDGCFGSRSSKHFMYNHGIATLAMAEAYWLTRNARYKRPAQKGLDFIARARNSYGAWRYEPRGGENDLSMTGWMVMALKSGKYAGLLIDPDAFDGARRFVDKMTDPEFGRAGYDSPGGGAARPSGLQDRFPAEKSASMTAVGILTRVFLGEKPSSAVIRKGTTVCLERLPTWNPDDGSIDMYYWYYGTLAIFQVGGKPWKAWNKAMLQAIVKSQHADGSGTRTGSWDPIGPWGHDGGRVYSTALMVMCMEVYYRYDRVFGLSR